MKSIPPSLLDEFKTALVPNDYFGDPGEPEHHTVEQIARDGNLAEGYCFVVSTMFVEFLADHGIEAEVIEFQSGSELYGAIGGYGCHYVAAHGPVLYDWTAAQFTGSNDHGNPTISRRSK